MSDQKKVLFIGFWSANDALTASTILPHLNILSKFESIGMICFSSIERDSDETFSIDIDKVIHVPIYPVFDKLPTLGKIYDFIHFTKLLKEVCRENDIDYIIARGACAGALAYKVSKETDIRFYVESFEPHAAYMLDSGVWGRWDPRYLFQKKWEQKQKIYASALMPVSNNYKEELIKEGLDKDKIDVIPCCVNTELFAYNEKERNRIRKILNVKDTTVVGVYVGKFGGIYYGQKAFNMFKKIDDKSSKFHLLILTPNNEDEILKMAKEAGFSKEQLTVTLVPHTEVSKYLSASDIAFSLHLPTINSLAFSPIKNGEYWANGLPIIISNGIGDDSGIIDKEKAGLVIDVNDKTKEFDLNFISREKIQKLAVKHRSFNIAEEVYQKWYS